ncbi:hypothetical protein SteCoe_9861 [Stentor coeruleus]|uniref:Uncharacterized protein n=1 Tax=Stentor coeruleus TaxID=5963 RepID=A0A1R2CGZ6_9CILI|nr:hypothetical protein SteCoe_9861 [Stentor coeruleus]
MLLLTIVYLASALISHLDLQFSNFDEKCADLLVTIKDEDNDIIPINSIPIFINSSPPKTIQTLSPTIFTNKGIASGSICFSFDISYSALVQSPGYIEGISTAYQANISFSPSTVTFQSTINLKIEFIEINSEIIYRKIETCLRSFRDGLILDIEYDYY